MVVVHIYICCTHLLYLKVVLYISTSSEIFKKPLEKKMHLQIKYVEQLVPNYLFLNDSKAILHIVTPYLVLQFVEMVFSSKSTSVD